MTKVALIDIRYALRLEGNPLLSKCLQLERIPLFVYPLELTPRFILGLSPIKLDFLYGSIKSFIDALIPYGLSLTLIDSNFSSFLETTLSLYPDICLIYSNVYPHKHNTFLSSALSLNIPSFGVSEVTTCTSSIKSIGPNLSPSLKSFSLYKNRDFILSKHTNLSDLLPLNLIKPLPLPPVPPLLPPFDSLNDLSQEPKSGGRTKGLSLMQDWISNGIQLYNPGQISDSPSSKLGGYLKYGCISRQELVLETRKPMPGNLEGNYYFWESILRNEYISRLGYISSKYNRLNLSSIPRNRISLSKMDTIKCWLKSETEYPLANAAMKQLRLTGYLSYPLRYFLTFVAIQMSIPPWVILHSLTYLLLDSHMLITWYYILETISHHSSKRPLFSLSLLQEERRDYIQHWSIPLSVPPLTLKYE